MRCGCGATPPGHLLGEQVDEALWLWRHRRQERFATVGRILADRRTGEADLRARLTDEAVIEAAAREAFWTDDMGGHHKPGSQPHTWENIPEVGRENYRTLVRAVLRAALATDPEGQQL